MVIIKPNVGDQPWTSTGSDMVDAINDIQTNYATKAYADALNPTNLVGNDAVWIRSETSGQQTCSNNTDTPVAFPTDNYTHSWVTKSANGVGHKFTVNVSGIWIAVANMRWVSGGGAGERYSELRCDRNGTEMTVAATGGYSNGTAHTMSLCYIGAIDAGRWIYARVYQASGGNLVIEDNIGWKHFTLGLIRRYA